MNILVGDDHLLFREGLCRLLAQMDPEAQFIEAGTFPEVVALCSRGTSFNLVLLDLQMPGWPGFSGLQQICGLMTGVPVVIISASESQADVRAALDAGAAGYIPKSSSVKIMLSALNLVFSGGVYLPPAAIHASQGTVASGPSPVPAVSQGNAGPSGSMPVLTQRQREVLRCLRDGKSNKQIAYDLNLSEGTVKIHVTAVMRALGVRNRTQAVIASTELMI
jgi:DNA-binding NarL/FixJ family response regulator